MTSMAVQEYLPEIIPSGAVEWEFVNSLLQDLQAEQNREELASLFGQWKLLIKAFRRVEERRMIRQSPNPFDWKFHKSGLCDLMSIGTMLQIAVAQHKSEDLEKYGFHRDLLDALARDLHNSFDEWHGQVPEDR